DALPPELTIAEPCGEGLHALIEPRVRDEIEAGDHERILNVTIGGEVVGDAAREGGPECFGDCAAGPAVVARVDPAVPEGESDVETSELRLRADGELVLETVEAPADSVVVTGLVIERVLAQLLHQ